MKIKFQHIKSWGMLTLNPSYNIMQIYVYIHTYRHTNSPHGLQFQMYILLSYASSLSTSQK